MIYSQLLNRIRLNAPGNFQVLGDHMVLEVGFSPTSVGAEVAAELGLSVAVKPLMILQVTLVSVHLETFLALERVN